MAKSLPVLNEAFKPNISYLDSIRTYVEHSTNGDPTQQIDWETYHTISRYCQDPESLRIVEDVLKSRLTVPGLYSEKALILAQALPHGSLPGLIDPLRSLSNPPELTPPEPAPTHCASNLYPLTHAGFGLFPPAHPFGAPSIPGPSPQQGPYGCNHGTPFHPDPYPYVSPQHLASPHPQFHTQPYPNYVIPYPTAFRAQTPQPNPTHSTHAQSLQSHLLSLAELCKIETGAKAAEEADKYKWELWCSMYGRPGREMGWRGIPVPAEPEWGLSGIVGVGANEWWKIPEGEKKD